MTGYPAYSVTFAKYILILNHYNEKRKHNNLNRMIPVSFEKKWSTLAENQKPIMTIFNYELVNQNGQH